MAIALLVLALFLAWWAWRRRRASGSGHEVTEAALSLPRSPFDEAVADILHRARQSRRYRVGCHELARLLCSGVVAKHGLQARVLTAREITERYGESRLTRLLVLLSELRFGRGSVRESDLEGACELAGEANSEAMGWRR